MLPNSEEFSGADSWSVEYRGVAYDDARKIAGKWFYRDLLTGQYRPFAWQDGVIVLSKNA